MTPRNSHSLANATVMVFREFMPFQALRANGGVEILATEFKEGEISLVWSEVIENPDFCLSFLTLLVIVASAMLHLDKPALGFSAWVVVNLISGMVDVYVKSVLLSQEDAVKL
jgi:hypothetical protein